MSSDDDWAERPPELDAEIRVAGEVYYFRRSLGLLRRVEQRFGPVYPMAERCERFDVTVVQLSGLLDEMTRGAEGRASRADVERWLFDEGIAFTARAVAKVLYELAVGNAKLREAEDRRRLAGEDAANPTRAAARDATG